MCQHQLSLVADFPFGFSSVKSDYAHLKAFRVHVRDTGNSQVKGEQLHKFSVGMKASFLFVRVPMTFGVSCICQRIYESLLNNWISALWSDINMIQKNILRFLLLKCFGVSATRCYVVLWHKIILNYTAWNICMVAIDHELDIRVVNVFSAALLVRREID